MNLIISGIITISLVGFLMGFFLSIPIPGPIYLLIISNGLKGKLRYCIIAAIGASIIDFIYCFLAVYGFTKFYIFYNRIIPYILIGGAVFLVLMGIKTLRTNLVIENIEKEDKEREEKIHKKVKDKTGFVTGIMMNIANPTLFVAWMISSFIVLSFVAALGFNTGGLDKVLEENANKLEKTDSSEIHKSDFKIKKLYEHNFEQETNDKKKVNYPRGFSLVISLTFSIFLSFGTIVWFALLAYLLDKFRKIINIHSLNLVIRILGVVMSIIGVYMAYYGFIQIFRIT